MAFGPELAGGILINVLSAGLQRSGSLLVQKIFRLKKVDKTLKGLASGNPIFQTALDDFIIVTGTYQGRYSEDLAAFLEELQKTGLIDAVAEAALIGKPSPAIQQQFIERYQSFLPAGQQDPNALYSSIFNAFRVTFSELSQDRVVYHALMGCHRDADARLSNLEKILQSLDPSRTELKLKRFADIEASLGKISRGLQQSYRMLRIETNRGPRKVEINRVYIPPKLSSQVSQSYRRRVSIFVRGLQKDRIESQRAPNLLSYEESFARPDTEQLSTFTYSEIQSSFKRVVVLGDPGGGKSTLCQKLCFDLARNAALAFQFPGAGRIDAKDQRLPLRVTLRSFEAAWVKDPQLDLLTYIERDLAHFTPGEREEIRDALDYTLESGRAVLAFDGLDEILDTSKRQELVDRVTAFCNKYPLCPVMVTSRSVGYDDAPLPDDFEELVLQKFDEPEILEYISKFMKVVADAKGPESKKLAEKFLDQTSANAADLRRNPLMLGLMAWLFMASGDVPSNRPEIYKECSVLMFERWDQRRGIMADENTDFDRAQLFVQLASLIYGNPDLAGGVSKAWLESTLKGEFESIYENRARAYKATKRFVDFITGRAWVMTEVGNDTYTFTHQTFLEYYFAVYLNDHFDSVVALLRTLRRRIVRSEWNEVTHLALQIKTFRSLKKQEEAIAGLGSMVQQARVSKQQTALMEFAARALQYLAPSEHSLRRLLKITYSIALERAKRGDVSALMAFGDGAYAASERQEYLQERIAESLCRSVRSTDPHEVRAVAPYVMSSYEGLRKSRSDVRMIHPVVLDRVRSRVRNDLLKEADRSELAAGLAWGMFGHTSDAVLQNFGVAPLFNFPFLGQVTSIDGLVALTVRAGIWRGTDTTPVTVSEADARLEQIGNYLLSGPCLKRSHFETKRFIDPGSLYFWKESLEELRSNERALLGALLIKAFCTSLYRSRAQPGGPSESSSRRRRAWGAPTSDLKILSTLTLSPSETEQAMRIISGDLSLLEGEQA